MIKFSKIINEDLSNVNDMDVVSSYFWNMAKFIEGWTTKGTDNDLNDLLARNDHELQCEIENEVRAYYGKDKMKLWRGLEFKNSKHMHKYFHDVREDKEYVIESFNKRTIFSWSESFDFARQWADESDYGLVLEAEIPIEMVVFSTSMFKHNEEYEYYRICSKLKDVGKKREFIDNINMLGRQVKIFDEQQEVSVLHSGPINCHVVEVHDGAYHD